MHRCGRLFVLHFSDGGDRAVSCCQRPLRCRKHWKPNTFSVLVSPPAPLQSNQNHNPSHFQSHHNISRKSCPFHLSQPDCVKQPREKLGNFTGIHCQEDFPLSRPWSDGQRCRFCTLIRSRSVPNTSRSPRWSTQLRRFWPPKLSTHTFINTSSAFLYWEFNKNFNQKWNNQHISLPTFWVFWCQCRKMASRCANLSLPTRAEWELRAVWVYRHRVCRRPHIIGYRNVKL